MSLTQQEMAQGRAWYAAIEAQERKRQMRVGMLTDTWRTMLVVALAMALAYTAATPGDANGDYPGAVPMWEAALCWWLSAD